MKSVLAKTIALSVLLGICGVAAADTTVRVVYICKVNDGKSMDDVRAANSAWSKYVNATVEGGAITSTILTPMVGDLSEGRFIYADDFPNVESWSASNDATSDSEEGRAIQAALDAAGTCASNSLYSAELS